MRSLRINTEGIWQPLKAGDQIDVVAPARQGKAGELELIAHFLTSWDLKAHIPKNLLADDLLCANNDTERFKFLVEALHDSQAAAIWCLRGGYGCTRLMPQLIKLPPPAHDLKWFIGFSDITVLHTWLNDRWHWPTLHGPSLRQLATGEVDDLTLQLLKDLLFGTQPVLEYSGLVPLNPEDTPLEAIITGGNLCLLENSIGTAWQFNAENKILLMEEINEPAYRIDRSLNHLLHAHLIQNAAAIILGDFLQVDPEEERRTDQVLQLFANQCPCPVYRLRGIGHGTRNLPVPLGIKAEIC